MNDFITKAFNLKEEDLDSIETLTTTESINYIITLKVRKHVCPVCGCFTSTIKDYKLRPIKQKIFINYDSTIYYKARRYRCKDCGKTFVESNPFGATRKKVTQSTILNILNDLKPFNSTFSSVARTYGLSVGTVIDIFDSHVQIPRKKLTKILCWDEFYFNRHSKYKYSFIIMDFQKKIILDIVESRKSIVLNDYFSKISLEERNQVEYIIIDMYYNYKLIKEIFFKQAILVVDPFHVMKKINDSVNAIRKSIMRNYDKKSLEYRLLKYRYKCILKNREELEFEIKEKDKILGYSITERDLVDYILNIFPKLKTVYNLKEKYVTFNKYNPNQNTDRTEKKSELSTIIKAMMDSNINEMADCAKTLNNWSDEILNSFQSIDDRRLSNGPIEGKNNYIKKIISNANGMSNFARARNKFIYSQNLFEKYSLTEHDITIKRKGPKRGPYKAKK